MIYVCGSCEHCRQPGAKEWKGLPGVRPFACYHPEIEPRVVPQSTTEHKATFRRVPEWCPRLDAEVAKSEGPQLNVKRWVTIELTERSKP